MPKQPIDFIFSPYRRQALAVLLLRPDEQFHVRQLERLTGVSAGSLHRELKAMAGAGLLTRERRGNQVLYQANRSCSIFAELASIFRKTVGLGALLKDALGPIAERIRIAFVFGSMATGEQHAGSDLDIFVLGDVDYVDVVKALGNMHDKLYREINPVVMTVTRYFEQLANHDRFVERLYDEPKIFVIGDEAEFAKLAEDRAT